MVRSEINSDDRGAGKMSETSSPRVTAARVGSIGVWSGRLHRRPIAEAKDMVSMWEQLGYGAVWIPEPPTGRDVLSFAAVVLGNTTKIVVATGIAVIWNRDPTAMVNSGRTLEEAFPGRFVLGVGVSHRDSVDGRGGNYERPLKAMREYLHSMREAPFSGYPPGRPAPVVVAALGPRMTELAGELADGVHPFLSTPQHTAASRNTLGAGPIIAVEQAVILSQSAEEARSVARANLTRYLTWVNYRRHLTRIGFTENDFESGGSDHLIDGLYAWGDEVDIERRVTEHLDAGADHVCMQVVPISGSGESETLKRLASALL
jgi:probable F420-dependent oxidoreductase